MHATTWKLSRPVPVEQVNYQTYQDFKVTETNVTDFLQEVSSEDDTKFEAED